MFQGVVKELFSQFGCVQSVELMDHPGSSQETGPKLSSFFKPAAKQVSTLNLNSVSKHLMHFKCSVNFACHFALESSHPLFNFFFTSTDTWAFSIDIYQVLIQYPNLIYGREKIIFSCERKHPTNVTFLDPIPGLLVSVDLPI